MRVFILTGLVLVGLGCNKNSFTPNGNNGYYPAANPYSIPVCGQNPGACVGYSSPNYVGQAGCPDGYVPVASNIVGSGGVACMNGIVLQNTGYTAGMAAAYGGPGAATPVQLCDPYLGPSACGNASGMHCVSTMNRQGYCSY